MTAFIHERTIWMRPSWQGGDVFQPRCMKPKVGFVGDAAGAPMALGDGVTCPQCKVLMAGGVLSRTPVTAAKPPRRRRSSHEQHLRAVWRSSGGTMFPFCRETRRG